jgi:hypothetical protein
MIMNSGSETERRDFFKKTFRAFLGILASGILLHSKGASFISRQKEKPIHIIPDPLAVPRKKKDADPEIN